MVVQNVIFLGFGETNQGWFYQASQTCRPKRWKPESAP
jgi:hypothetical protein